MLMVSIPVGISCPKRSGLAASSQERQQAGATWQPTVVGAVVDARSSQPPGARRSARWSLHGRRGRIALVEQALGLISASKAVLSQHVVN
jgi:hypothetical protein